MGKEDMFLKPIPPDLNDFDDLDVKEKKEAEKKEKIRTIGPDGTIIESKSIKEQIEKIENWDRQ